MFLVTFYPWWTNNRNNKQHFNVLTTEQRRHTHTHTAYLFCVLVHKVSSTLQLIIKRQQVNSPPANQSERGGGGGGEQPIRSQLWFTECPKNPAERFCEREDIRPVWQHFSADFKLREKQQNFRSKRAQNHVSWSDLNHQHHTLELLLVSEVPQSNVYICK